MNEPANKAVVTASGECPTCGAPLRLGDTSCWLCRAIADCRTASADRPFRPIARAGGFSLASLMMFVTLLSVVFGLSTIAPGIGIPLGVLLLVAWGRTVSVSRRREALGNPLTWSQHIQTYLSSFGFVVALLLMVTVGVCVAAGSVCFGIFSAAGAIGGSPTYQIGSILVCVVGLFAAIGTIRLAAKWNDYQWRRTTVQGQDMSNGREKR